ncbi:MAG TPA: non-homologous end-joining DNA ligase [Thermoleophilaceae bacterium]|nr:non-homologous end-joining DNA ligase [Thermoleophilaceae bacterium]
MNRLAAYRGKRNAERTPEPGLDEGDGTDPAPAERLRFVVQEHHARRLHWDLRLERDGVLVSWAVPKGIPPDPSENRLAVHTEDHPLEYLDFSGEIPAGSYGAGTMTIWDRGTYECHKFRDDEVMVTFHGERLRGRYVLFPTRGENWMIHRMDPPQDPGYEPLPRGLEPMRARVDELPPEEEHWAFEIKWDGVRALLYASGGRIELTARSGNDITARYPELRGIGAALGAREAVLDGEVVALDADGRPDFGRLQRRMHLASERAVRRRMSDTPVAYMAFDLLHLDGRSTLDLPYAERRELLEALAVEGPHWQTPAYHAGDGRALLEASRAQGLEGIVAKRLESGYEPGRRSGAWLKIKNVRRQEVVLGGWLPGQGARHGRLGALLAGVYEPNSSGDAPRLRYVGRVGTGFSEAELTRLAQLLDPIARQTSPFAAGARPPREANYCEPQLVAEVGFAEWTHTGTLRAPRYLGLRDDKDPREVTREPVGAEAEPAGAGTGGSRTGGEDRAAG